MPIIPFQDLPNVSLKDKIVRTLAEVASRIADALTFPIREGLHNLHTWIYERYTEEVDRVFGPTLDWLRNLEGTPPELQAFIDRLRERRSPGFWMVLIAIFSMTLGPILMYFVPLLMRRLQMQVSRAVRPARSSTRDLTDARVQGWISDDEFLSDMADMGFEDRRSEWLLWIAHRWPAVAQVFELLNRAEIDNTQAIQFLRRQGFNEPTAEALLPLRLEIPPIQDLIRFAVREAYTPSAIAELGLHQEFPAEIMPDATKRGLSQKYALDYWAAHWQLPSVTQVFEMFHRRVKDARGNVFDRDAMARFLKYADYALPWRQMLIDIAYNPYTRRELPRLFRLGVIRDEDMYSAYLDLGLSPDKARVLTDASIVEARETGRDLSRADIEDGYKRKLLSRPEAEALLGELRYDADEVAFILDRVDLKLVQAQQGEREGRIKQRYTYGLIDAPEATRLLSELGVPLEEIQELIAIWTETREAKVERPSLANLEEFYRHRVIAGPDLETELRNLGYQDRYVQWIMANIEAEIREAEEKRSAEELSRRRVELRVPTKADYLAWLKVGIINQDQLRGGLRDQGYTDEAIDRYLAQAGIVPTVPFYRTEEGRVRLATLKLQVREALITLGEFVSGLLSLGVPPSLADALAEYEEVRLTPPPAAP